MEIKTEVIGMKYMKEYQGVITGSFAGRDDGQPETKRVFYNDLQSLAKEYGKHKGEKYYVLQPLLKEELEAEIPSVLKK